MSEGDVIFALASAVGPAGVAVMRISGGRAPDVFSRLGVGDPPLPRVATLRRLTDPDDGEPLDDALVLWFPAPRSFTGENVAELHLHGGPAVIDGVAQALARIPGFRPAEPGEFTRRAFHNGKLDLAEAEGLADLIGADTAAARAQALWQMDGGLSALHQAWRARLIETMALAEAMLDFADEPVPDDLDVQLKAQIFALRSDIGQHIDNTSFRERLSDGFRIVLTGAPNVGKSSLLNALARRDAAIVTSIPGTTRDVLDVRLDLNGVPATVSDTAGLRATDDPVEHEGVRRAEAAVKSADFVVEVRDCAAPGAGRSASPAMDDVRLVFYNKADASRPPENFDGIAGSALTGQGISDLEQVLGAAALRALQASPAPAITRARHRSALSAAYDSLTCATEAPAPELAAEELRSAAAALGRILGVVDVEDVLDHIFSAFCIGK